MKSKCFKKALPKWISAELVFLFFLTGTGSITGHTAQDTNTRQAEIVDCDSRDTKAAEQADGQKEAAPAVQESGKSVNERISHNYSTVSDGYVMPEYTGKSIRYSIAKAAGKSKTAKGDGDTRGYTGGKVLDMRRTDQVTLKVHVPKDGQYTMVYDYLSYDASTLPIRIKMKIDGAYPFYECKNLEFKTCWKKKNQKEYDRYQNELATVPDKVVCWQSGAVRDPAYRRSRPLKFQLSAGEHSIEIGVTEGNFLLGDLTLKAPEKMPAYTGSESAKGKERIMIQGEDYRYTNDSSIRGSTEYDPSVEPCKARDTVLNTLDPSSFAKAGQSVSYEFEIAKAGNYCIAQNYRQSGKSDLPVFVDVYIDGKIPNTAFEAYGLAPAAKYQAAAMKDKDGKNLTVHFDKGKHTITYTISMAPYCHVLESLDQIMNHVNGLALEITKVVGTNIDKHRDINITKHIPDIIPRLNKNANRLEELEKDILTYTKGKRVSEMSTLSISAERLRELAKRPEKIPERVQELSAGNDSINRNLANTVDQLMQNDLAIDRIYIYQEGAELPGGAGFFQSVAMGVSRFISSFADSIDSTDPVDEDHIQVWANRPTQYVQLMQRMADQKFTPESGIRVDISTMPDPYKLVLANSAGKVPDVATGINYTIPYELALRGMLADMTGFEDFTETAKSYEPGFFMASTIGDAIYAMPETMNFQVMFTRTDILESLGLRPPETMEELTGILPELQMRGMNVYYPTAGMSTMRNFHGTAPLVRQNGGALYYEDAHRGTALEEEASAEGFIKLTDLFTVYNMDVNVENFYQHFRNGDLPIGIADVSSYNLIKNAAPEISGSWQIQPIPGTLNKQGVIDRSTCGGAESTVIFKKKDNSRSKKAWEFVKWWSSDSIQAEFGQTIQIIYGNEYMWPTANIPAFLQLPLETGDKEVIAEWAKNVEDIAYVPGTYLLEREMSNAFNDIVVNGADERMRLHRAVKNIDREIDRKLEEFGYTDSYGTPIREYRVPTAEHVKKLLGRIK